MDTSTLPATGLTHSEPDTQYNTLVIPPFMPHASSPSRSPYMSSNPSSLSLASQSSSHFSSHSPAPSTFHSPHPSSPFISTTPPTTINLPNGLDETRPMPPISLEIPTSLSHPQLRRSPGSAISESSSNEGLPSLQHHSPSPAHLATPPTPSGPPPIRFDKDDPLPPPQQPRTPHRLQTVTVRNRKDREDPSAWKFPPTPVSSRPNDGTGFGLGLVPAPSAALAQQLGMSDLLPPSPLPLTSMHHHQQHSHSKLSTPVDEFSPMPSSSSSSATTARPPFTSNHVALRPVNYPALVSDPSLTGKELERVVNDLSGLLQDIYEGLNDLLGDDPTDDLTPSTSTLQIASLR
ncbi:hypothetical protein CPB83DRAFT_637570 [Crepidotus variabilis]|uniref:Uncharacterized protein n=1 Tax=Crepidotus variabilis TaxID=179855 RepID=A0A9P6JKY0_9AGAR|nr:hypothetical protein CPB83DRAFT_637570 [Crepidotus variabilis]